MNIKELIARAAEADQVPMKWVDLPGKFAGNAVYLSPALHRGMRDWIRREAWSREIPTNGLGLPEPGANRALMIEANARHVLRDWRGPLFEEGGKRIAYTPELAMQVFAASDELYTAIVSAAAEYAQALDAADEATEKN